MSDIFKLVKKPGARPGNNITNSIDPIIAEAIDTGLIDVLSYSLFANKIPTTARDKIPFIFLEEYNLTANALISRYKYLYNIVESDIKLLWNVAFGSDEPTQNSPGGLDGALEEGFRIFRDITGQLAREATGNKPGLKDRITGQLTTWLNSIADQVVAETTINDQFTTLFPYNNLYSLKSTGFSYVMPYYDNKLHDIGNKFEDTFPGFFGGGGNTSTSSNNIATKTYDAIKTIAESFLTMQRFSEQAAYVEFPKFYAPGEPETVTINFQLLNTIENGDLQRNYDLLFLLAYQNLPFRQSIVSVKPSKIYSLLIPGDKFLPYCYMDTMKVNYRGNRRILNLQKYTLQDDNSNELPKQSVQCIVPDCYDVSITFKALVKPAANFLVTPNINIRTLQGPLIQQSSPSSNPPTVQGLPPQFNPQLPPLPQPAILPSFNLPSPQQGTINPPVPPLPTQNINLTTPPLT